MRYVGPKQHVSPCILREHRYKGLNLAQLLGKIGVFLTKKVLRRYTSHKTANEAPAAAQRTG
jgi:hypothetical protein